MNKGDFFVDFNEHKDKIDLSGFSQDYLQNVGVFNGKLVGLPSGIAGNAIVVNTGLASELGLDIAAPLTWDSIVEMGKQVQAKNPEKYLINADTGTINVEVFRPYLMQLTGNKFIVDDTKTMGFTKEQLVQALDYIKGLYDNKVYQPAGESAAFKNSLPTNPKWISGDFVMAYCVSSTITPLTDACPNGEFDVIQMPLMEDRKDDGYYASPPQLMCISNTTKSLDDCLAFYDYFFNDASAAEILKDTRSVPAVESARQICVDKGLLLPIVSKSVDLALELNGTNEMGLTTSAEVDAVIIDMLENVAYGNRSTEEIASEGIQLLEGILSNL